MQVRYTANIQENPVPMEGANGARMRMLIGADPSRSPNDHEVRITIRRARALCVPLLDRRN